MHPWQVQAALCYKAEKKYQQKGCEKYYFMHSEFKELEVPPEWLPLYLNFREIVELARHAGEEVVSF